MLEDLLANNTRIIFIFRTHLSQYRASSSTDEIPRIGISRRKSEEEKKISGNGARTTANFVKNKSTHSRTDSTIRFGRFASFCPQFHSRLSSSPWALEQYSSYLHAIPLLSTLLPAIRLDWDRTNPRVDINEISEFKVRVPFWQRWQLEERSNK